MDEESISRGVGSGEAWYLKGRIEEARAQDPELSPTVAEKTKYLDRAALQKLCDPANYLGESGAMVDRVLAMRGK